MSASDSNATQNQTPTQISDSSIDAEAERVSSDETGSVSPEGGEPEAEKGHEEEEEEQGECGFCLFMKGGGCKDAFIGWEKCIEEAEKNNEDLVDKCADATAALKKCMEAHSDYYEPILRAEKVAEQQAIDELEKEAAENRSEQNAKEGPEDSDKEGASASDDN